MKEEPISELKKKIARLEQRVKELEESNFLYQNIVEKLPLGLQIFDRDGYSYKINASQKQLLGLPDMEEGIGQFNVLTDPYSKVMGADEYYQRAYRGETLEHEFEYDLGRNENQWETRSDIRIFHETIFPIKHNNRVNYVVALVADRTQEIHTEQELRESEKKFRSLYTHSPLPYQSLDEDGCILDVNPAWLDTLGYERDEVIGRPFHSFLPDGWEHLFRKNFSSFKQEGVIHDVHFKMRHKKGQYLDVAFEGCIGSNPDGSFRQTYCVFKDITGQKRAEESLRKSQEHLETTLNSIGDAVISTDIEGYIMEMNPVARELTGWAIEEARGRYISEVFHIVNAQTHEKARELIETVLRTGNIVGLANHTRLIGKDGKSCHIADSAAPIKDAGGNISGVVIVFRDVTQEYNRIRELRESRDFLNTIFQSIQDGISVLNTDLTIRYVNPVMEKWYSQSLPIPGKKCHVCYHNSESPCDPCPSQRALKSGQPEFDVVSGYPSPNAPVQWLELYSYPIIDSNSGELTGVVEFVRDITERTRAREELASQKQRLVNIIEATNAGTWEWNVKTGETIFNERWAQIAGYSLQELAPVSIDTWMNMAHPDDLEKSNEMLQQHFNGQKDYYECEVRMKHRDGHWIWILDRGKVTSWTDDGAPLWMFGTHHDITGRKKHEEQINRLNHELQAAEEELRASNDELLATNQILEKQREKLQTAKIKAEENAEQFRKLIENAPEPIFIQTDWTFSYVNDQARKLFGADGEKQLLGEPVMDRFHPGSHQKIRDRISGLNDQQLAQPGIEEVYLKLDGSEVNVEVSAVPINYQGKKGALVFARDITERKRYIREIEQQNIFIQTVLDNLPVGIALHRFNEGNAVYMNKQFVEIYGWPEEELSDIENFFVKVYPDDTYRKEIKDRVMSDIDSGDPKRMRWEDVVVTHKNGEQRVVEAMNIPLFEQNTMVSTVMDMTDLKHYEEQLIKAKEKAEESDRLKSAFLANMSHEIRTPMNGIMGFSQLLRENEYPREKQQNFLDIIYQRTRHLLRIINDIVDLSKIEANQMTLNKEDYSLNKLLTELLEQYRNYARTQKGEALQLKMKLGLESIRSFIYSDPTRFRQIMDNLLSNAIKFTDQGVVEFGYELQDEDTLLFYVKDTGIGIAKEHHESIFERFSQVSISTDRLYEGTGLGLTISRNLVGYLGGKMWVESKVGEGAAFYFTLPYQPQSREEEDHAPALEQMPDWSGKTILVIEDDPTSIEYLRHILKPTGARLILCEKGEKGFQAFRSNTRVDLILLDLKLPDTDGLDIAKHIRQSDTDIPIIAQTAYAMSGDARKSREAGCNDYISKPIDKHQLREIIGKYF